MIEIDGSLQEGGGQIIRTAIGLSSVTGKPVRVYNIRARRCNPGLAAQHLTGIKAVKEICSGKLKNAKLGSKEIEFIPGRLKEGNFNFDVGTAGAISLVLQSLIIPSIHTDVSYAIKGGTDVRWSPLVGYFQDVFCYFLRLMNVNIKSEIIKHGFYPKGNGLVKVEVKKSKLKKLDLIERGKLKKINVYSVASNILKKRDVAERQVEGFKEIIPDANFKIKYIDSLSPGTSMLAYAEYENGRLGGSAVGERGKMAEDVGREAAKALKFEIDSKACVDQHCVDQLLPFMALAKKSRVRTSKISYHVKTNIAIIEKFLDVKFKIKKDIVEL